MAKRATRIPTFNPKQTLKSIREDSLNPVIDQLFAVETNIETVIVPTQQTVYKNVTFDEATKQLTFTPVGNASDPNKYPVKNVDLTSIVPVQAGITVKGYTLSTDATLPGGGQVDNTSTVKFQDGVISKDSADGYANVCYEWGKIVPAYQRNDTVTIQGWQYTDAQVYNKLEIQGLGASQYFTFTSQGSKAGTVRIDMPLIPEQQTAEVVKSTADVLTGPFNKIKVTGNVGGSIINGDTLEIDLPTGGGGTFTVGYFKGFYTSVDEIPTDNLVADRSCAYILTKVATVDVYVLYVYKGETATDKWVVVTTKPPLIYDDITPGSVTQGIISIKANKDIQVDSKGQLNLDGLMNTGGGGGTDVDYFMGIYDTLDEIKAITNPVRNKTYAMLRSADAKNGYLPYIYRSETSDPGAGFGWKLTPALGHLMFVEGSSTTPQSYTPIYGIKVSGAKVTNKGVLDITKIPLKGTVKVTVTGKGSPASVSGEVRSIRFPKGASNVILNATNGTVDISPAQLVVSKFNEAWLTNHSTEDFLGKIYYNEESGKWMGMTNKDIVGTNPKWTPVLHKNMSTEVTDLNYRLPAETPKVTPANEEDDRWKYSGNTYLEKDDTSLPDEIKSVCGGFIQTEVKEDSTVVDIAKKVRTQVCHADDGSGKIFMRAYDKDASKWKTWVRTSFSSDDMKAHKEDPSAHKSVIKHYRLLALTGKYQDLIVQMAGTLGGGIFAKNVHTLADNYGYSGVLRNYLDAPYGGIFRLGGVISFGGYKEAEKTYPTGTWQVLLRKRTSSSSDNYQPVGQFIYQHTANNKPYPSLAFSIEDVSLEKHQELVINLTFTDNNGLKDKHPDLYIVPTRSYAYIEDMATRAASFIGNSHRILYGNLDVIGDVGVKSHHTDFKPDKTIRVFGEIVNKTPVVMTLTQTP